MKRILFVLALMLILTVCFVGEAFALNRPWTEADDNDNGEEHPWGGEGNSGDPTPITSKSRSYISYTTGYTAVDFIFKYFFLEEISTLKTTYYEKQSVTSARTRHIKYSTVKEEGSRK